MPGGTQITEPFVSVVAAIEKPGGSGYAGDMRARAFFFLLCLSGGGCDEPEPAFLPERPREAEEPDELVAEDRREGPPAIPAPPDVRAVPASAARAPSGLASRILRAGAGGARPGPRDGVTIHYVGWRAETGEMFASSRASGPASFQLDRVIAGWTEGLQRMVAGEKRRFWIPPALAYQGREGPQGMLVYDIELIGINPHPDVPEDFRAPPANAGRSGSGLAWIVLEAGEGERHPTPTDRVRVHYSGWRAEDGELFDTSRTRGGPSEFTLDRVIPGWTEGVGLMVEGERRRLWIPPDLAYEGRTGPQGTLVFDVELIEIR